MADRVDVIFSIPSQLQPSLPEVFFLYDEVVQIVEDPEIIADSGISPDRTS